MAKPKTKMEAVTSEPEAPPTVEERLHTLRSVLRFKTNSSQTIVESFAKELADSSRAPIEVLAWSSRAFEAAAVLETALDISKRLDSGESIPDIHASLVSEALRGARSSSSSTSSVNNLAAKCRLSAVAEFEDLMRHDARKIAAEIAAEVVS